MSFSLPPEILDLIVDFLHDKPDALRACCLVSKSWVHRTRKHIFARIEFPWKSRIELWKKTFSDPSNSPARYTRSLSIRKSPVVTSVDTGVGGWTRTFSGIVRLYLDIRGFNGGRKVSLIPLHGLSPTLKSLCLVYGHSASSSETFSFMCSFPLLEDLALVSRGGNEIDGWNIPSTSPKLTGCLDLMMLSGTRPAVHRLLELPSGLRFSKIVVLCPNKDLELMTDLISKCSDILEFLRVGVCRRSTEVIITPPLDLSRLTRLKRIVFGCGGAGVQWITMMLRTAESINLEQITISLSILVETPVAESVYWEWQDLDRVLLQFWTSRSIRPKVGYDRGKGERDLRELAPRLLPELTSRKAVDLFE